MFRKGGICVVVWPARFKNGPVLKRAPARALVTYAASCRVARARDEESAVSHAHTSECDFLLNFVARPPSVPRDDGPRDGPPGETRSATVEIGPDRRPRVCAPASLPTRLCERETASFVWPCLGNGPRALEQTPRVRPETVRCKSFTNESFRVGDPLCVCSVCVRGIRSALFGLSARRLQNPKDASRLDTRRSLRARLLNTSLAGRVVSRERAAAARRLGGGGAGAAQEAESTDRRLPRGTEAAAPRVLRRIFFLPFFFLPKWGAFSQATRRRRWSRIRGKAPSTTETRASPAFKIFESAHVRTHALDFSKGPS